MMAESLIAAMIENMNGCNDAGVADVRKFARG
jgi:hypothetical protein